MRRREQPPVPADQLEIGYVARAHGLRGEVGIRTLDPESTALDEVERVVLRTRAGEERIFTLRSVRPAAKELLVAFEGVGDRSASEALVGASVRVFRDELSPPGEGEYFQGDLVGLRAVRPDGGELGTVEEIWSFGPVPNLVIRGPGLSEELVVPFADDFVPEVDLPARRIVIVPPEFQE